MRLRNGIKPLRNGFMSNMTPKTVYTDKKAVIVFCLNYEKSLKIGFTSN